MVCVRPWERQEVRLKLFQPTVNCLNDSSGYKDNIDTLLSLHPPCKVWTTYINHQRTESRFQLTVSLKAGIRYIHWSQCRKLLTKYRKDFHKSCIFDYLQKLLSSYQISLCTRRAINSWIESPSFFFSYH